MKYINRRNILALGGATTALIIAGKRARAEPASPPSNTPPPLEVFARTPLINDIAISPDGKRLAVVTQKGDDKFLLYFDLPDGKPQNIYLGKAKVRDMFWGSNDNVIVTNSTASDEFSFGNNEYFTASTIDTKTQKAHEYFPHQRFSDVDTEMTRVAKDGKYTVTVGRYEYGNPSFFKLYGLSPDGPHGVEEHVIFQGPMAIQDWVMTPDGEMVAYSTFDTKLWALHYRTGANTGPEDFKKIYETSAKALTLPDLSGLGADGKSIVVRFHDGKTNDVYRALSTAGALSDPLYPEGVANQSFPLYHPITWRLAGFAHRDETLIHSYTDPLLAKLYASIPKVLGEGYRSWPVAFAEDPRKMVVYSEGNGDAGSYYVIDFSTGAGFEVGANYPDLPTQWVTQKQPIVYKAADGLEIHGYLTLPPFRDAKNLPLVVLPHGGPESRDYIDFDWQTQTLASRGYAVLQPNFRGSDGYGESFVIAGHGEWGRKMQTDLSDGVRHLAAKGLIDPKRVAIFGASYGGYSALAGATLDPGVYRCAISVAGPSDLKAMVDWEDRRSDYKDAGSVPYWRDFMGDPARWAEVSPARQAGRAYCPILLIHGTDDSIVPIEQSQHMESALKAANKSVEFITYKGQDHWESIASTRIAMMQATVDFIQKYNPV